jgi:hypothetical protein
VTLRINYAEHNNTAIMLSTNMLSVTFYHYAECHYAESIKNVKSQWYLICFSDLKMGCSHFCTNCSSSKHKNYFHLFSIYVINSLKRYVNLGIVRKFSLAYKLMTLVVCLITLFAVTSAFVYLPCDFDSAASSAIV